MRIRVMTVLALALLVPAAAGAQRGQGANVAEDPYLAFLRATEMGSARLGAPVRTVDLSQVIRTMPENFPKEFLPADAMVAAASVAPESTVLVASVKRATPFDHTRYEWSVEDGGWIRNRPSRSGFVLESSMGMFPPTTFCKGTDFATVMYRSLSATEQLLRIAVGKDPQRSCAPMGMGTFNDVAVPMISVPTQVRMTGGGGGSGIDEITRGARLETALDLKALVTHFVPQITAAAWKVESGPTSDAVMSITRFSGASKNGDPLTAMLIVTKLPDTPFFDAMFRVIRNKPVR